MAKKFTDEVIVANDKLSKLKNDKSLIPESDIAGLVNNEEVISGDTIASKNPSFSEEQIQQLINGTLKIVGEIIALSGNIGGAIIEDGRLLIKNANIGESLKADTIDVRSLSASNAFITNLVANNAFVNNLVANNAFVNNLVANQAFINNLVANQAFITNLVANQAFVNNLVANQAFVNNLVANQLFASNINVKGQINIDNNDSTYGNFKTKIDGSSLKTIYPIYQSADPEHTNRYFILKRIFKLSGVWWWDGIEFDGITSLTPGSEFDASAVLVNPVYKCYSFGYIQRYYNYVSPIDPNFDKWRIME